MFTKHKTNDITLSKEAIAKLSKKKFMRQFNLGNIAVEDFLEFIKPPPYFSQVSIAEESMRIAEKNRQEDRNNAQDYVI